MPNPLELRFTRHLSEIARRTMDETGYNPSLFIQMLHERGGLATARALLHVSQPSSGFTTLWERGRLDLTVEAVVVQEPWSSLFTPEELGVAGKRLRQLGYKS